MQGDNRDAKPFSYNLITKSMEDVPDFMLKLIDNKNNDIELEDGEKKL